MVRLKDGKRTRSVEKSEGLSRLSVEIFTRLLASGRSVLPFARGSNQRFHMLEVDLQGSLPLRRQPVGCSWNTSLKGFLTDYVLMFLELSRMHAQITVGCS